MQTRKEMSIKLTEFAWIELDPKVHKQTCLVFSYQAIDCARLSLGNRPENPVEEIVWLK